LTELTAMLEGADESGPELGVLHVDGKPVRVWLRIQHDGIEFVGHLWFGGDPGLRDVVDRAALPGRAKEDVVALARRLTPAELEQRYERALRERRKYDPLRRVTQDMLARVRRLNQVAIALQAGLMDQAAGADQLAETEAELHALVADLCDAAGVQNDASEHERRLA
jgi:hypothetical protein